jgi:hypothetical protein
MCSRFQGKVIGFKPEFQFFGTGKHAYAFATLQSMAGFLSDDAGAVCQAVFQNCGGWDPEVADSDSVFVLVFGCVIKPEK